MERYRFALTILTAIIGLMLCDRAMARGREEFGNKPQNERNYTEWPGIMPLVNDHARVYTQWVNGNEHFYCQGSTKELNAALANFAKLKLPKHFVVLRAAPGYAKSFGGKQIPFDWELHVLGGIAGSRATEDTKDLYWYKHPVLTIYVGGDIKLAQLEIPKTVTLRTVQAEKKDKETAATEKAIARFIEERKDTQDK